MPISPISPNGGGRRIPHDLEDKIAATVEADIETRIRAYFDNAEKNSRRVSGSLMVSVQPKNKDIEGNRSNTGQFSSPDKLFAKKQTVEVLSEPAVQIVSSEGSSETSSLSLPEINKILQKSEYLPPTILDEDLLPPTFEEDPSPLTSEKDSNLLKFLESWKQKNRINEEDLAEKGLSIEGQSQEPEEQADTDRKARPNHARKRNPPSKTEKSGSSVQAQAQAQDVKSLLAQECSYATKFMASNLNEDYDSKVNDIFKFNKFYEKIATKPKLSNTICRTISNAIDLISQIKLAEKALLGKIEICNSYQTEIGSQIVVTTGVIENLRSKLSNSMDYLEGNINKFVEAHETLKFMLSSGRDEFTDLNEFLNKFETTDYYSKELLSELSSICKKILIYIDHDSDKLIDDVELGFAYIEVRFICNCWERAVSDGQEFSLEDYNKSMNSLDKIYNRYVAPLEKFTGNNAREKPTESEML